MMTTKTITTKNNSTITVEIERTVRDKVSNADGYKIVVGREIVDRTTVTLRDANGKYIDSGELEIINPKLYGAKIIASGAVARIGNVYIKQAMLDMITSLIAEAEAETPKSEEQIAIENKKAQDAQAYDAWYNSAEQIAYRKLMVDMDSADSDY